QLHRERVMRALPARVLVRVTSTAALTADVAGITRRCWRVDRTSPRDPERDHHEAADRDADDRPHGVTMAAARGRTSVRDSGAPCAAFTIAERGAPDQVARRSRRAGW